jgi:hypothetical protein
MLAKEKRRLVSIAMREQFTIYNFIENRWADAKKELQRRDPAFVNKVEAYGSLWDQGLVLPELTNFSQPHYPLPHPLPQRWYRLLETTFEVVQELERIDITTSQAQSAKTRKLARYYYDMWVQNAFNLCEKVKLLVTFSCRLYRLADREAIIKHYHSEINKVQDNVSKSRHALVHGADEAAKGGRGVDARAITDNPLGWDVGVVFGSELIPIILEAAGNADMTPGKYAMILGVCTRMLNTTLAAVLLDFDHLISQPAGSS